MGSDHALSPATDVEPTSTGARRAQRALPTPLRAAYEELSGVSLADVDVSHDSSLPGRIGALAYTQGDRIHLAPGQERHLAHEAWHVVQQRQGRVPTTTWVDGHPANTDHELEAESDRMAARVDRIVRRQSTLPAADPPAAGEQGTRIRRSTRRSPPDRPVLQGQWVGLDPPDVADAFDDPTGWLIRWAEDRVDELGVSERQGLRLLRLVDAHPESDEFVSVVDYLESTVRSIAPFTLDYLLSQVRVHIGVDAADRAVLDGSDGGTGISDHVEDDRPPAPEEPVELWNLWKLDLRSIRRTDPSLRWIAVRIAAARPAARGVFAERGLHGGLLFLQALVLAGALTPLAADEEGGGGGEDVVMQGKFSAGTDSGPKGYMGAWNGFGYQGVSYRRDGQGSINFGAPTAQTAWQTPLDPPAVQLTTGTTTNDQGLLQNGNLVDIPRGNRGQHFNVANRIVGNTWGSNSPANQTWHHLTAQYWMVLVDRRVHQQHGHNGGFLIWN